MAVRVRAEVIIPDEMVRIDLAAQQAGVLHGRHTSTGSCKNTLTDLDGAGDYTPEHVWQA